MRTITGADIFACGDCIQHMMTAYEVGYGNPPFKPQRDYSDGA